LQPVNVIRRFTHLISPILTMLDCFRACHLEKLLPSTYLAGASPSGLICVLKHTNPFKRPVILSLGVIIGPCGPQRASPKRWSNDRHPLYGVLVRDASLGGLKGLNPSGFMWGNRSVDVPKNRPPAVPTPSGGLFLLVFNGHE
jgi:hypothetical protein